MFPPNFKIFPRSVPGDTWQCLETFRLSHLGGCFFNLADRGYKCYYISYNGIGTETERSKWYKTSIIGEFAKRVIEFLVPVIKFSRRMKLLQNKKQF